MADNIAGKAGDKKAERHHRGANNERGGATRGANTHIDTRTTQHQPDPPNWVEKGGLLVLVLTLCAAVYAGFEAARLADLTERAIEDGRTATIEANRAWLSISDFDIAMVDPDAVTIRANISDVGHDPAEGAIYSRGDAAFLDVGSTVESTHFHIPENNQCVGLSPALGRGVYFPGQKYPYAVAVTNVTKDGSAVTREKIQTVKNGTSIFYLRSCVAYSTFGKAHYTAFCSYLYKDVVDDALKVGNCPTGNWAN